jgi:molecular chaperone GrpE
LPAEPATQGATEEPGQARSDDEARTLEVLKDDAGEGDSADTDDIDEDIFTMKIGGLADLARIEAEEVSRLAAERDEYLAALQRLQADFDNSRKRAIRQQTETLERANEGLLTKLLPVLDALDLAMAHSESEGENTESLGQIGQLLRETLAREGLERIDAVGEAFDPTIHDAVAHEPVADGDEPAGEGAPTVGTVLRAGYKLKGRVIRPAMVMVRG